MSLKIQTIFTIAYGVIGFFYWVIFMAGVDTLESDANCYLWIFTYIFMISFTAYRFSKISKCPDWLKVALGFNTAFWYFAFQIDFAKNNHYSEDAGMACFFFNFGVVIWAMLHYINEGRKEKMI